MRELFAVMFQERELLLRVDGRVHYLRLGASLQIVVFLCVATMLFWGVGMTGASLLQRGLIQAKNAEIREARVAYQDLLDEVTVYQRRVAQVTVSLRENQESLRRYVRDAGKGATADAANASAGLLPTVGGRMASLDRQLAEMAETSDLLDGTLQKIQLELRMAEEERAQLLTSRSNLRDHVVALRQDLNESRGHAERLAQESIAIAERLERAEAGNAVLQDERSQLDRRVARLETDLSAAHQRNNVLQTDLQRVVERLRVATGDSTAGEGPTVSDVNVEGLLTQLSELHSAHETALSRLTERATGNLAEAERVITMTGLDVERLLGSDARPAYGKGGPLVEGSTHELGGGLIEVVDDIERQLTRWDAYRSVLAALPLVAPVDHYHISSSYGSRVDPFTGKRAWHRALDLAGWTGSPVYATAPGKIVFADWKGRFGKLVEIDHGFGIRTRYAHLQKILVKEGDTVGFRHRIGLLGTTGRSTGPHVHYEILYDGDPINPLKFIQAGRHVFKE